MSSTGDYPRMIDPDLAVQLVLDVVGGPEAEVLALEEAVGRVLAQDARADRDYPPFRRAMMDGFAVCSSDAGQTVEVIGELAAGDPPRFEVTPGRCVAILTGAACPPGADAVVPLENVVREANRVRLPSVVPGGAHVAAVGSECPAGTVLFQPGQVITPLVVAVLATWGLTQVRVWRLPRLQIVSTGSELIPCHQTPSPWQIRNSNGPMLAAMAQKMGLARPAVRHVPDCLDAIVQALDEAHEADFVLLSGGVSAGTYDLVPKAVAAWGGRIVFHKVSQKPGKPLLVAVRGRQVVFGLPGNPLACHLGFDRYVGPAIRQRLGRPPLAQPCAGILASPVRWKGGRTFFLLARAQAADSASAPWSVEPLSGISSADLFTPSRANCYIRLPPGQGELAPGTRIPFTWIGTLE